MTDNLYRAVELADRGNGDEIPYDKSLIIDWMDDKVETLNKVIDLYKASPQRLEMGEFDEKTGDYQTRIDTVMWMSNALSEVFISRGLKILADAVGATISVAPFCKREDGEGYRNERHYFTYKGIEFFELCDIGKELR